MTPLFGACFALLLTFPAFSMRNVHVTQTQRPGLDSVSTLMYKRDCWKTKPVSPALAQIPGAGLDAFEAYATVEKDGYLSVDCTKDYMHEFGDKFGDGKFKYKLGSVSNVSIVHYTAHVPTEDRQQMSPNVCFEFCRTVPDMGFFGITNGRDCYCTPYYKAQEDDSSMCDAPCDGDKTQMCGGKTKSSVFEMHMCSSTASDLTAAVDLGVQVADVSKVLVGKAKTLAATLQSAGQELQKEFGEAGDPGAANHMQNAKETAGELMHAAEAVETLEEDLRAHKKDAGGLANFAEPAEVTKAERLMEQVEVSVHKAQSLNEGLGKFINATSPVGSSVNASAQYFPVMYFVDKEFENVPTTCTGGNVGKTMVAEDSSQCAAYCDGDVHDCVGFFYVGAPHKLCFLLSSFKTATYYTGCKAAPFQATCMAKVSKFVGTTLKPDGSGKCKQCLKEAVKADRCY